MATANLMLPAGVSPSPSAAEQRDPLPLPATPGPPTHPYPPSPSGAWAHSLFLHPCFCVSSLLMGVVASWTSTL